MGPFPGTEAAAAVPSIIIIISYSAFPGFRPRAGAATPSWKRIWTISTKTRGNLRGEIKVTVLQHYTFILFPRQKLKQNKKCRANAHTHTCMCIFINALMMLYEGNRRFSFSFGLLHSGALRGKLTGKVSCAIHPPPPPQYPVHTPRVVLYAQYHYHPPNLHFQKRLWVVSRRWRTERPLICGILLFPNNSPWCSCKTNK